MAYLIQNEEIGMRYFMEEDFDVFMEYRNDPEIAKYQGWDIPYTPQDGLQFFLSIKDLSIYSTGQWLQLIIEDIKNSTILGDCAYRVTDQEAEFGITIRREFQGKGWATSAIRLLFELLFNKLGLHRVIAIVAAANTPSILLMDKLRMRRESHYVKSWFDKYTKTWADEYQFALLKEEYLNN